MPLPKASRKASKTRKRAVATAAFHDLRHGKTFVRTRRKFGATKARKQMIAIALSTSGQSRRRRKRK